MPPPPPMDDEEDDDEVEINTSRFSSVSIESNGENEKRKKKLELLQMQEDELDRLLSLHTSTQAEISKIQVFTRYKVDFRLYYTCLCEIFHSYIRIK